MIANKNFQHLKITSIVILSLFFLLLFSCKQSFKIGGDDSISPKKTISPTPTAPSNDEPSDGQWTPPIGITSPDFGIIETVEMFRDEQYDFNGTLANYKDAGNGPFSHYVKASATNCNDSNENGFGSEQNPRCTIPVVLSAGSVVEVHDGIYTKQMSGKNQFIINAQGTKEKPVFIRGVSGADGSGAVVNSSFQITGDYLVVENLLFDIVAMSIPHSQNGTSGHATNISIRNNEFRGSGLVDHGAAIGVSSVNYNDRVSNIVIYHNEIHHYGKHDHTSENDYHGVGIGKNALKIWMLDNHVHHNGGDSVQVHFYSSTPDFTPQFIYIGRNDMHDDAENAVDLKGCLDVIVSQNKMYNYDGYSGVVDGGGITVTHYDSPSSNVTKRAWYIFNEMYNAGYTANQVSSGPTEIYFVGNIIHDITGAATGWAFIAWSSTNLFFVGNTSYNTRNGISISGTVGGPVIENNIIGNFIDNSLGKHLIIDSSAYRSAAIVSNNLFYNGGKIISNNTGSPFIDSDPLFTSTAMNNFELQANSPAIDAGKVSSVYKIFNEDLYGIDIDRDFKGSVDSNETPDIGALWP